jgi:hypothetical protein
MNQDFECPRCGHCCQLLETEQEPVAWMHTTGTGHVYFRKKPQDKVFSPQPVYTVPPKREWVGLTDEEIDALSQAPSLTDELMDCVDRLGSEADTVDPRVWQHLLVYAPKPEEEPVAWITNGGKGELWWHRSSKFDEEGNLIGPNQDDIPLYTAPPKKEWVGLTDQEINSVCYKRDWTAPWTNTTFARAIEAKLREKNKW